MQKINLKNIDKSNWKTYRFDEIAKSISERIDPTATDLEIYIGLEHLDPESIHIKRTGKREDVKGTKLRCYPGDVIFGRRRAYQRKAAIVTFDGFCSAHSLVLRTNPEVIDPKLFPFFLHSDSFMHRAVDISVGSLSPTINWGTLKTQEFLLPSKDQQARLAELLWAADEVVEKEVTLLKTIICSKFSVLENKIIEFAIGKNYLSFGDLGKWISGGTPSKRNREYWNNGTIPWITPKDMKGEYLDSSLDYITNKSVTDNKAKIFSKGKIVLVWRSGILQHTLPIARVERDFCINQDLKVFVSNNKKFNDEFVRVFLKVYSEKIRRECVKEGTTVQSIDTDSFMKFKIPEIEINLQETIIKEEVAFENSIILANKKLSTTKALQKSLINQIF